MAFDDSQPRDDLGRWTSGGGGAVGGDAAKVWANTKPGPTSAEAMLAASPGATPLAAAEASLQQDQTNERAVSAYVAGGDVLNHFLRADEGERLTAQDQGYVAGMDAAIANQLPTSQDTVLYRGVAATEAQNVANASGQAQLEAPSYGTMQPGTTFTDRGFASTTTNFSTAQGFARSSGTILEVHAPEGTQGLSVPGVTGADLLNESEVVLPRGTEFQVLEPVDPMTGIMKVTIAGQ